MPLHRRPAYRRPVTISTPAIFGSRPRFLREHSTDLALAAVVLVVAAAAMAADLGDGRQPDAIAYLFAVGLGALMLVRRTLPVLALVASAVGLIGYYAAGYPSIGLAVPLAGALYSAAEAGRTRWAVGTSIALLVVSTYFRIRAGVPVGYLIGYEFAWTVGLMAATIALGDGVRWRRRWRALAAAERLREAADQVQRERLRIARDLHDSLAHTTSVISLHTHVAAESIADDPQAARAALANVRSATAEAITALRTTVGLLRAPADTDGLAQLDSLIGGTTASGVAVDLQVRGDPVELPVEVDTAAFRIVQESLTNVLRHADAHRIEVELAYTATELRVRVTDDGAGSAPNSSAGHGLVGMGERAKLVGGSCSAAGRPGGGFRVEAALPVGEP